MSLKERTISGVMWAFGQQLGVQGINFGVQILLARLLLPEAFGLIALIQIFMAIGQALMDGGMTSSLIRTKNPSHSDYSTVFAINLFSSVVIYFILFFTAPYISSFFNQPQLSLIIKVYTFSFIIQALVGVQTARLTKEMNFKLQMYMQIPSTLVGGIAGVFFAYKGFGVWSLVWMHLITTFLFMLQHWFRTNWRPSLMINKERFKYHFNFGYKLTLSALLTSVYLNSFTLVIGKFFSATMLGFYNQADTLRMFPVGNLTYALQKVTYPMFSSLQDDNTVMRNVFKRITSLVFFIVTPIMLLLILIAEPFFRFLLTDKWLPSVPFFQILCTSAIVYPLSMYNLNIILAKGRSDLHFKLELMKKGSSIIFLLLIIPFGIYGVVYAAAISMLIHAFFNALYSGRLLRYPLFEQVKNIMPTFMIGVSSMITVYIINLAFKSSLQFGDLFQIIFSSLIYLVLYLLLSYVFKVSSIGELRTIILQASGKLRRSKK